MSPDAPGRSVIRQRLISFMNDPVSERFEDLALDLFRRQWRDNPAYQSLCRTRGVDPDTVERVEDIPAVPTGAFKTLVLATGPAARVFRTSGTTRGTERRGAHHMVEPELYRKALRPPFKRFVVPDRERMTFLVLASPPVEARDSSLGFMFEDVIETFGLPDSTFLFSGGSLDETRLVAALRSAAEAGDPVALLGTTFGLVHAIDALAKMNLRFRLPAGSRIMDTGGFKGRSREVTRPELIAAYLDRFGVDSAHVINEYGMTELSSQFYDASLTGGDPEIKLGPHWVRTSVIDPETGRELGPGRPGLLRHFDLANLDSAAFVETEDLGFLKGNGFVLLGRATGAEARGCSLEFEDPGSPMARGLRTTSGEDADDSRRMSRVITSEADAGESGGTPAGAETGVQDWIDALTNAGESLRTLTVEERAAGLSAAADLWSPGSPVTGELARVTGYTVPVVEAGLERLFGAVTKRKLLDWWGRTASAPGSTAAEPHRAGEPKGGGSWVAPGFAVVLSAGNIPGVGLFPAMGCLLAGVPVLLKSASAEPVLAPAWHASLREACPQLADAIVCASWKGGDERIEPLLFSAAERVFVYGRDATILDLETRHPGKISGFGSGASFAIIGPDPDTDADAARALALDTALWDQQGCLSPHGAFVIGDPSRADRFAEALAGALSAMERTLPRGRMTAAEAALIRRYRFEAEAAMVAGAPVRLRTPPRPDSGTSRPDGGASGKGTSGASGGVSVQGGSGSKGGANGAGGGATGPMTWTVVTDSLDAFTPTPGCRTLWVRAVTGLDHVSGAIEQWRGRLQGGGIGPGIDIDAARAVLERAGVTHVVPLGTMQAPEVGWLNKGRDMLAELMLRPREKS